MTTYGSLGDLSDAQLQAALDRFDLGRLESARPFTVGLFGKNVGLVTDSGRWVLRGDPWPMHTDEQFRRERFWASCVRARCPSVPVPWPFHIESDESLFGWPYQLTPWMPGVQERNAVGAAALGRAAAALRSVTFEEFGEWSPITDDVVPTYVHHDLKPGNCVCVDGEVSGLFDLGEGLVADPLENLARALWDLANVDQSLAATFLAAYERASAVRVDRARVRSYVLLDLLVIWEFGTRPDQPWFDDHPTFEGWATSFSAAALEALGT